MLSFNERKQMWKKRQLHNNQDSVIQNKSVKTEVSQNSEVIQQSQKNYIDNSPGSIGDDFQAMSASSGMTTYMMLPHKGWGILNFGLISTMPYYEDVIGGGFDPEKDQKVYVYAGKQSISKSREIPRNNLSGFDKMSGQTFYEHYTVTGTKYQQHIVPREWGFHELNNQFGKDNWSYRDLTEYPTSKDATPKNEISNIIRPDKSSHSQRKSDIDAIMAKMLRPTQTKGLEKQKEFR